MAEVRLERVSCVFRHRKIDVRAVDDLSLHVADGEFMVLVGPSGCGKTTTLRLIAGLEAASSGEIRIGDRVVNRVAPKDRDVAMVFQSYALYPHMTVFKNLAFGLKMRRVPRAEIRRKVEQTSSRLSIAHLLDRKPAALSGGEKQRVALGRAIVREPQAFLFDEPLSNLDATLRLQMRSELKSLHRELRGTVIHVTHDQEEAMILGDRIAVLNQGVLQQVGTPMEVYQRPANRFVAGFIGTPPMNCFPGRLERSDGGIRFVSGIGRLSVPLETAGAFDGRIVLGIRPQHVILNGAGSHASARELDGSFTVRFTEPLGESVNVHLASPSGDEFLARVSVAAAFNPGDTVKVALDAERLHWFADDLSGRRLC